MTPLLRLAAGATAGTIAMSATYPLVSSWLVLSSFNLMQWAALLQQHGHTLVLLSQRRASTATADSAHAHAAGLPGRTWCAGASPCSLSALASTAASCTPPARLWPRQALCQEGSQGCTCSC